MKFVKERQNTQKVQVYSKWEIFLINKIVKNYLSKIDKTHYNKFYRLTRMFSRKTYVFYILIVF